MDENLKSVGSFLIKAKQLISQEKYNLRGGRSKNKSFMERHGLTRKDVVRIVQNLHTRHRVAGPEEEEMLIILSCHESYEEDYCYE